MGEVQPCHDLPPRGTGGKHLNTMMSSNERKWQRYVQIEMMLWSFSGENVSCCEFISAFYRESSLSIQDGDFHM